MVRQRALGLDKSSPRLGRRGDGRDGGKSNTVARSQMRNFSSVSLPSARELHGGLGCKGKPLCERAESRADEGEEGSRRLGKPGISWTVPVDALPSFRIGCCSSTSATPHTSYWPRRVGSIATANNASPDLHDWIGVAKLKLLPATDVPSLYRHANAGEISWTLVGGYRTTRKPCRRTELCPAVCPSNDVRGSPSIYEIVAEFVTLVKYTMSAIDRSSW